MLFSGLTQQVQGWCQNFDKKKSVTSWGSSHASGNRTVPPCNLKVLVNINTMIRKEKTMIIRLRETCTPYPSDQMTDDLTNVAPPPEKEKWHLKSEDCGAARRALYAARMQLG
jgi:hypothetical protein